MRYIKSTIDIDIDIGISSRDPLEPTSGRLIENRPIS